jgi:dCTP deaminase
MILADRQLREWARDNVDPYDPDCINPASIDLRLGAGFIDLGSDESYYMRPDEVLPILPGDAILATTLEYIKMPTNRVGVLYLKSSLARKGLDHALAGFVDPGFEGQLTMELHSHRPVTLHPRQRIVQLVLCECYEPDSPYSGRYQGQEGPTRCRK